MRTIYLYGEIAKKYGKKFKLDVATAGEAIRAITTYHPTFAHNLRDGAWHIVRGKKIDSGFSLDEQDVNTFNLGKGDLHILPAIAGSKRGGILKVVLGVVLVGAAFFLSGGALGAAMPGVLSGMTYGNMAMLGVALTLAGVSSMLSPEQKGDKKDQSYTFNGPGNTSGEGSPVPLVYGEVITGSTMISAGIDIDRLAPAGGSGSSGGGKK